VIGTLALCLLGLVRVIEALIASTRRLSHRPPDGAAELVSVYSRQRHPTKRHEDGGEHGDREHHGSSRADEESSPPK
jgi:hypothetical protein